MSRYMWTLFVLLGPSVIGALADDPVVDEQKKKSDKEIVASLQKEKEKIQPFLNQADMRISHALQQLESKFAKEGRSAEPPGAKFAQRVEEVQDDVRAAEKNLREARDAFRKSLHKLKAKYGPQAPFEEAEFLLLRALSQLSNEKLGELKEMDQTLTELWQELPQTNNEGAIRFFTLASRLKRFRREMEMVMRQTSPEVDFSRIVADLHLMERAQRNITGSTVRCLIEIFDQTSSFRPLFRR